MAKFYVVWAGRNPGVYDDWNDAKEQITNFPGARYKGFTSAAEAAEAYRNGGPRQNDSADLARLITASTAKRGGANRIDSAARHTGATKDYFDIPEIDLRAWAVDAACAKNPGPVEYRGVELLSGRELFRIGPLQEGTNNLGEFLAIVHALALQKKMGISVPIYSDSLSGRSWVKKKHIRTTLQPTQANRPLFNLLERAMHWLQTNQWNQPLLTWDTKRWGEIPADFGRK